MINRFNNSFFSNQSNYKVFNSKINKKISSVIEYLRTDNPTHSHQTRTEIVHFPHRWTKHTISIPYPIPKDSTKPNRFITDPLTRHPSSGTIIESAYTNTEIAPISQSAINAEGMTGTRCPGHSRSGYLEGRRRLGRCWGIGIGTCAKWNSSIRMGSGRGRAIIRHCARRMHRVVCGRCMEQWGTTFLSV